MNRRAAIALALMSVLSLFPGRTAESPRALIAAARFMYVPAADVYLGTTRAVRIEMRVPQGTGLLFLNIDGDEHDIVSGLVQEHYPDGDGYFRADRTRRGEDPVVVAGVELLAPGRYPFFCSVHFGIPSGVLEIVAA